MGVGNGDLIDRAVVKGFRGEEVRVCACLYNDDWSADLRFPQQVRPPAAELTVVDARFTDGHKNVAIGDGGRTATKQSVWGPALSKPAICESAVLQSPNR